MSKLKSFASGSAEARSISAKVCDSPWNRKSVKLSAGNVFLSRPEMAIGAWSKDMKGKSSRSVLKSFAERESEELCSARSGKSCQ